MRIIHKNVQTILKFDMFHNPDSKRKNVIKKYLKILKHEGFPTKVGNLLNLRKHFLKNWYMYAPFVRIYCIWLYLTYDVQDSFTRFTVLTHTRHTQDFKNYEFWVLDVPFGCKYFLW